jgi:hypothetical protein
MVALAALCVIAYSRCFGSDFVFDSHFIIGEDIRLRHFGAKSISDIFSENYWWPSIYSSLYRPLSTLTFAIEYSVLGFGARPAGYQMVNLILHITVVVIAFRLLMKMGMRPVHAFAASAWLALHPYGTEVVPNIVGLSDILALLSVLLGIHLYLDMLDRRREFGAGLTLWGVVAVAGLLSKENAISLIALVFWHACTLGRERMRELARSNYFTTARYVALGAVLIAVISAVAVPKYFHRDLDLSTGSDPVAVDNPLRGVSPVEARVNALAIFGENIVNCIVPTTISADYSYGQIELGALPPKSRLDWRVVGIALGVLVFGLIGLCLYTRWPAFSFAVGAIFIMAMPTANIILLIGTIRADRLVYAYILPVVVCVGLLIHGLSRYLPPSRPVDLLVRRGMTVMVGVFMILLGVITNLRATDWRTTKGFWKAAYETSPNSFKTKLGWGGINKGEKTLDQLTQDIALMRQSVAQLAESPVQGVRENDFAMESLAYVLADRGRLLLESGDVAGAESDITEAEALFSKVISLKREKIRRLEELKANGARSLVGRRIKNESAVMALAEIKRYKGDFQEAIALLEENLDSNRFNPGYLIHLSRAKVDGGDWEGGLHYLLQALLLQPDDKAGSREANWILNNHRLPEYAKAYAPEDASSKASDGALLNLDDPRVSDLGKKAALNLIETLEAEDLAQEKAIVIRRIRVHMNQPEWLYNVSNKAVAER